MPSPHLYAVPDFEVGDGAVKVVEVIIFIFDRPGGSAKPVLGAGENAWLPSVCLGSGEDAILVDLHGGA